MSEKEPELYDLTRRKVLGGLTAVGLASAGAGLGTSAYFSDEETYKNNRLVAGSLDLKVDWEEHYSDWSDDEMVIVDPVAENGTDPASFKGVRMDISGVQNPDNWIGVPDPSNPMVYVHKDALDQFMANTALEAYPDDGDNGSQSLHRYSEENFCDILADTPEDLNPDRGDPARTKNQDTWDADAGEYKPLVSLEDVKPGDFGELTLSFHLCDNPGYVWMNGQLVSASENGVIEPESKDADENPNEVELLDQIQTLLWYDEDGDNVYEPAGEGGLVDAMLVLDHSGSMGGNKITNAKSAANNMVNALSLGPSAGNVGLVGFDDTVGPIEPLTDNASAVTSAISGLGAGGSTNIEGAVSAAQNELANNGRSGAQKVIVLLSDGAPNVDHDTSGESGTNDYDGDPNDGDNISAAADPIDEATSAKSAGTRIFTVGYGISSGTDTAGLLEAMASDPNDAFLADTSQIQSVLSNISQAIAGEECFFRGSLRELLNVLNSGNGIPLDGDRQTPFNEVPNFGNDEQLPSDPTTDARECFSPATNNNVGLAWWLPVDHGNEAQTDSIAFDLGFYTEQCRHNDGAGMDLLTPTRRGSGWAKIEESFNGTTQDSSSFARARFGDNNPGGGPWEAAVGNEPGDATTGNYEWTSGETISWTYTYSANDDRARFILDNAVDIEYTGLADQPDGRVAIQTKADEAMISVENVEMLINGDAVELSGPNSVTASNDDASNGDGRALEYLVINSDLDGDSNFSVSGEVTVTLQNDYDKSNEEGVAMDVVLE